MLVINRLTEKKITLNETKSAGLKKTAPYVSQGVAKTGAGSDSTSLVVQVLGVEGVLLVCCEAIFFFKH